MSDSGAKICAVLAAADPSGLYVLTLAGQHGAAFSLPSAPFNPKRNQSFEGRLHDWASVHTTAQITRIEHVGASISGGCIRICLLALVSDRNAFMPRGACWAPIDEIFPWENWGTGEPQSLSQTLRPALDEWARAGKNQDARLRAARLEVLFARQNRDWSAELSCERFDLLYEAYLVPESLRDRTGAAISVRQRHAAVYGQIMQGDDRRSLAEALGLLRAQIGQKPVMQALLPAPFTLGTLQKTIEEVTGQSLHTQNFRRDLTRTGQVRKTGKRGKIGQCRAGMLWEWTEQSPGFSPVGGMPLPRKTP